MKIAVLGTGDVGKALSKGFKALGHDIVVGTRDPKGGSVTKFREAIADDSISFATFKSAVEQSDIAVLAVGWDPCEAVCRGLEGAAAGKVLIDATNPLVFKEQGKQPELAVGGTNSAGELVQEWTGARVVKAFNIIGNKFMCNANVEEFAEGVPDMFIAGDDREAKAQVAGFLRDFKFDVVDLGDIKNARYIEAMAMVWIAHCFNTGFSTSHGIKLLRKGNSAPDWPQGVKPE